MKPIVPWVKVKNEEFPMDIWGYTRDWTAQEFTVESSIKET